MERGTPKVILITGASMGIGLATAQGFVGRGYTVFGTSRQPEKYPAAPFPLLPLDVQHDSSVTACVDAVMNQAGRIDVLVNNAGVSLSGAAEEASIDEAKNLLETNFFGVMRMVNAVLPIMREQHSGHIVNISSLAGVMGVPYIGLYSASKAALEGYSEALRYEVKGFGVRVSLVEPGDTRTGIYCAVPARKIPAYDGVRERANAIHQHNVETGTHVDQVARVVLNLVEHPRPRLRFTVTKGTEVFVPLARRLLPYWLIEPFIRGHYKLDNP